MNFKDQIIKNLNSNIEQQKEAILIQKLEELGIKIDLKEECKKKFPNILRAYLPRENKEIYYYNDGSSEGQKIITFELIEQESWLPDENNNIKIEYKYY